MKYIFRILMVLILNCFSTLLFAQQTIAGKTIGKKGTTNFTEVANFEKENPEKVIRLQQPPEEKEEEQEIEIENKVTGFIPPFTGRTTIIPQETSPGQPQKINEFPCNNFLALNENSVISPPDVHGAAGFDHLMVTLNSEVSIQNKQGTTLSTTSLLGFWNGLGGHTDIYDPKITYDPYDKRWFFVCCASRDATNSALLIAVSQTPDPTGGWITYTIKADPGNKLWFDYPSLGFNRNWITVGGYLFKITGASGAADTVSRSRVWVLNKSVLYAAPSNITVPFFDQNSYFHISPAVTYSPTDNKQWLVSVFNPNSNNSGFLKLFSITGTQATPVFNVESTVNVGGSWSNGGVTGPQSGSATGLDLGDDRMLQSTFRSGTLWVGNTVCLPAANPTTCAAQVVAINTATGTATENIRTSANTNGSLMQAYPSITVNRSNDIFFGYSTFRSNSFVTSTISYRRNDGQGFFFYYFKSGEDWYVNLNPTSGLNRWGDYSATYIDPEDDVTAWTIQEYTRPRVGNSTSSGRWSTWWAKICPGSCADNLTFGLPYNSIMGKYEANNTITSTAQVISNSFIKYDAGVQVHLLPGFKVVQGNKFQAYIEGCGGVR